MKTWIFFLYGLRGGLGTQGTQTSGIISERLMLDQLYSQLDSWMMEGRCKGILAISCRDSIVEACLHRVHTFVPSVPFGDDDFYPSNSGHLDHNSPKTLYSIRSF